MTTPGALSVWDDLALAVLVVSGALYARGVARLAHRGAHRPFYEGLAFFIGWASAMAMVLPPIDALALELFSIHMFQHEMLMLVAAPLMAAGRPITVCLWALPERWRLRAGRGYRWRAVPAAWQLATAPLVAWAVHGATIWLWHLPRLYEWAVRNEAVHAVQHVMFLGTAMLFWFGLLHGRYGRAGYGAAVFYVFATAVHTGLLGALLVISGVPAYSIYVPTTARHGLDAVADQQIAGLLMWIAAGVVSTLFGIALFAAWLGNADRRGAIGIKAT